MTARISIRTGRSVVAHDTDFAAGLRHGATVLVRAQKTGRLDGHAEDARCLAAPTSVEDDRHARQLIMWLEEEVGSAHWRARRGPDTFLCALYHCGRRVRPRALTICSP
jgi:hypothetical protein